MRQNAQKVQSKTDDGRRCYPRTANNFLFFPDTSIVEEARKALPQLYTKRFNEPMTGCEDLMQQHETYCPYVIDQLYDCQMKRFIDRELQERPGINIDKTLQTIMCRKRNYAL